MTEEEYQAIVAHMNGRISPLATALMVQQLQHPAFNPIHPIVSAAKAVGHAVKSAEHAADQFLTEYAPAPDWPQTPPAPPPRPKPRPRRGKPMP